MVGRVRLDGRGGRERMRHALRRRTAHKQHPIADQFGSDEGDALDGTVPYPGVERDDDTR
jgi:hypothetical protein